jgi:hypothetical protein
MFSFGPNPTREKKPWSSSTCLLYGVIKYIKRPNVNLSINRGITREQAAACERRLFTKKEKKEKFRKVKYLREAKFNLQGK